MQNAFENKTVTPAPYVITPLTGIAAIVFSHRDGTTVSVPNPRTFYWSTKYDGVVTIRANDPRYTVVGHDVDAWDAMTLIDNNGHAKSFDGRTGWDETDIAQFLKR